MKKLPIRKPKNKKERIEWSCLGSIGFTFAVFVTVVIILCLSY